MHAGLQKQEDKPREETISRYSTLMRLHLEHCFQLWSSQSMSDIDILNEVHQDQGFGAHNV